MNRLSTLIYLFYRPIMLWNMACSLLGLWFIAKYGVSTTGNSLLLKIMGYISSIGYQYFTTAKSYFYFRNAGYSIRRMYSYTFLVDLLIYIVLIILYTIISYGFAYLKS